MSEFDSRCKSDRGRLFCVASSTDAVVNEPGRRGGGYLLISSSSSSGSFIRVDRRRVELPVQVCHGRLRHRFRGIVMVVVFLVHYSFAGVGATWIEIEG